MREYGAVENQMDGMIRDIEELQAENEKLKAQNEKLKNYRVLVPKPIDHWGDGLLFAPEGLKQLYNDEEVEEIAKEREDYKHRAEVAERALQYAVSEYHCDECPCLDCNSEIRGSQECIDCICEEYKRQAEKELAEVGTK